MQEVKCQACVMFVEIVLRAVIMESQAVKDANRFSNEVFVVMSSIRVASIIKRVLLTLKRAVDVSFVVCRSAFVLG